jgi:hypothetical protein
MKNDQSSESINPRRKPLEELEEIARVLTQTTLVHYEIPESIGNNLVLGTLFDGDDRIFQLYIPGDRPEDAQIISSVRINVFTGQASIEVFLNRRDTS